MPTSVSHLSLRIFATKLRMMSLYRTENKRNASLIGGKVFTANKKSVDFVFRYSFRFRCFVPLFLQFKIPKKKKQMIFLSIFWNKSIKRNETERKGKFTRPPKQRPDHNRSGPDPPFLSLGLLLLSDLLELVQELLF